MGVIQEKLGKQKINKKKGNEEQRGKPKDQQGYEKGPTTEKELEDAAKVIQEDSGKKKGEKRTRKQEDGRPVPKSPQLASERAEVAEPSQGARVIKEKAKVKRKPGEDPPRQEEALSKVPASGLDDGSRVERGPNMEKTREDTAKARQETWGKEKGNKKKGNEEKRGKPKHEQEYEKGPTTEKELEDAAKVIQEKLGKHKINKKKGNEEKRGKPKHEQEYEKGPTTEKELE